MTIRGTNAPKLTPWTQHSANLDMTLANAKTVRTISTNALPPIPYVKIWPNTRYDTYLFHNFGEKRKVMKWKVNVIIIQGILWILQISLILGTKHECFVKPTLLYIPGFCETGAALYSGGHETKLFRTARNAKYDFQWSPTHKTRHTWYDRPSRNTVLFRDFTPLHFTSLCIFSPFLHYMLPFWCVIIAYFHAVQMMLCVWTWLWQFLCFDNSSNLLPISFGGKRYRSYLANYALCFNHCLFVVLVCDLASSVGLGTWVSCDRGCHPFWLPANAAKCLRTAPHNDHNSLIHCHVVRLFVWTMKIIVCWGGLATVYSDHLEVLFHFVFITITEHLVYFIAFHWNKLSTLRVNYLPSRSALWD